MYNSHQNSIQSSTGAIKHNIAFDLPHVIKVLGDFQRHVS